MNNTGTSGTLNGLPLGAIHTTQERKVPGLCKEEEGASGRT